MASSHGKMDNLRAFQVLALLPCAAMHCHVFGKCQISSSDAIQVHLGMFHGAAEHWPISIGMQSHGLYPVVDLGSTLVARCFPSTTRIDVAGFEKV